MKHHFDTSKIFSIWFQKQSVNEPPNHAFLPYLNQKRLISQVRNNPHAQVTLIYCSESLSQKGLLRLKTFCETYKIKPLDLKTILDILTNQIKHPPDHKAEAQLIETDFSLCMIALREIRKANNGEGGNLAVASDIVRLLNVSIEQGGIYCDFDVSLSLKRVADGIDNESPFICYGIPKNAAGMHEYSNEFLAFSTDKDKLTTASKMILLALKAPLLKKIKGDPLHLLNEIEKNINLAHLSFLTYLFDLELDFESVKSIYDLRKMLQSIDSFEKMVERHCNKFKCDPSKMVEAIYPSVKVYQICPRMTETSKEGIVRTVLLDIVHSVYINTVVYLSGPSVFSDTIQSLLMCEKPCLHSQTAFKDSVMGTNMGDSPNKNYTFEQKRLSFRNDASWTTEGASSLMMRSQHLAARTIQNAWHAHRRKPSF